jgi:hypothetical protein
MRRPIRSFGILTSFPVRWPKSICNHQEGRRTAPGKYVMLTFTLDRVNMDGEGRPQGSVMFEV